MTPGEKITALRNLKGFTQEELTEQLNKRFSLDINRNQLAKWETDSNQFSWEVGKAYCRFFGCTLDELIFDTKMPESLKRQKAKRAQLQ